MLNTKMIGAKIIQARKKINVSQAQLAELLFISSQAVGKWERGESMPDIVTLNRLAEILGVDLNYFSAAAASTITENTPIPSEEQSAESVVLPPSVSKQQTAPKWNMSSGNWVDADFSGLKNLHEKFGSSNMQRCKFIGSDLSGLLLKSNNVDSCDFSSSDISNSQIQGSHFSSNKFNDCFLKDAEFSGSHIYDCDFTSADFSGIVIKSGGFEKNTIVNATFNRTSFNTMYLAYIVFEGTMEECSFENCSFKRVTFQSAKLVNTFFKNKSLKGIRFIDCQADRMTYEFLKNGKADLTGIKLLTE